MSRRQKLEKFQAISQMPHVYQNFSYEQPTLINYKGNPVELAGSWNADHFKREAPLVLELACGRGEYCIGLAQLYPAANYIGIDIKGARIWKGAKTAVENKLTNVAFLRTRIECIEHFFGKEEVDTIWIIFPDPFLKTSKSNRRLTAPPFLDRYKRMLKKNGTIKLKTDSPELFEFTLEVIQASKDVETVTQIRNIHDVDHGLPELDIITYYEQQHIANKREINYLEFRFA